MTEISEAVRKLAAKGEEIYGKVCTVNAVDEAARTADVSPLDESTPILGVNLQANQNSKVGVVLFPVVGSFVVVSFLNRAAAVVVATDEIDHIEVVTKADIVVKAGGKVTIENGDYSLKKAFDDLFAAIGKLTVTTGVGPSGTPINISEFQQIQQKIAKFLQ